MSPNDLPVVSQDPLGHLVVGIPVRPEPAYPHQPMPPPYVMTPPHAFYSCDSSANPTTSKASPPPYFYGIPVGFSPPPYAPHSTFRPPQLPNGEAATTPTQGYAPAVEATADFSGHDHKTTNQPYAGDHSCVTHLNFFDNHVRKLEGLSKWPALLRLTVKWNDLKSFQGLQEASYLRWIDASGNLLTSMKGAGTLPSMEWLDLHFNNLATLSGLVSAPNLTWLSLNSNHLEHLSGVEAMPNLRFLDVSNNDLKSISGVERCQQLQEINLATNFLGTSATEQVKCLAELPHLFRINVHNNDFTPSEVERIATHFKGWKNQCEVIVDEEGCRQVGHLFDVPPDIPKDWKPPKKCILL